MNIDTSTEAVKALMEGVTEGPWMDVYKGDSVWTERHPVANVAVPNDGSSRDKSPNARFIAASRQLVPALISERNAIAAERDAAVAQAEKAEAELATLKEMENCERYLKPGQSPSDRMKQDQEEILGLMKLLQAEKERNEKLKLVVQDVVSTNAINTEERDRYRHERDALKAERDALREANEAMIAWDDAEKAGPDYGGLTRETHPEGEAIWRKWWDEQNDLCALAFSLARAAIAKAKGETA